MKTLIESIFDDEQSYVDKSASNNPFYEISDINNPKKWIDWIKYHKLYPNKKELDCIKNWWGMCSVATSPINALTMNCFFTSRPYYYNRETTTKYTFMVGDNKNPGSSYNLLTFIPQNGEVHCEVIAERQGEQDEMNKWIKRVRKTIKDMGYVQIHRGTIDNYFTCFKKTF